MVLDDSHNSPFSLTEKDFADFFHKYYQSLCLFAYNFVKDEQTAEDIVEDCFVNLWKQSIKFNHKFQIKSWLYRAVRNASINWLRQQQSFRSRHDALAYLKSLESEEYKLQQMIRAEVMEDIFAVIDTLPAGCRKVFTMFYLEGKNLKKIAEELNLSIHTIKSQKAKGLAILRQKLVPLIFCCLFYIKLFASQ